MKRMFLFLLSICALCSLISVPAMAEDVIFETPVIEDIVSEDLIYEEIILEDAVQEEVIFEDVIIEVPSIEVPATEEVAVEDFNIETDSEDVIPDEDVTDETVIKEVSSEENTTEGVIAETVIEETVPEEIMTEENIIEAIDTEDIILNDTIPEEDVVEAVYSEDQAQNIISSISPRYSPKIKLFSFSRSRLSDEQKAAELRNFLAERLLNIDSYEDEITLEERRLSGNSTASDVLFIDLSELPGFSLYANSNDIDSTRQILSMAFNDILNKFPGLFWLNNRYYWEWMLSDYKVTRIGIELNCYTDFDVDNGLQSVINEIDSLTAEFNNYVRSITDLIPEHYSDYEKVIFVNDYLCTNYQYDTRYYTSNVCIYNAYDFFKEGKGVCQAYTLAFMAVMDELGIRCDSVASEEMNHIWNLVELDGKWYHIDVTWNDPCFNTHNKDTLGLAKHQYFLLSSERIQDSEHEHYGFDIESYGYEIGTEFDEMEVDLNQSFRSPFIELNGTWYNTVYNEDTRTCELYSFESSDISLVSNSDFQTPLFKIGSWGYIGSFSYLSKYKDIILFNTPDSICGYDGNEISVIYTPEKRSNEKIYGFDIKGDTIRIQLATNPNESGMKKATLKTANLADLIEQSLTIESYDETTKQAQIFAPEDTEGILVFASYDKEERLIDCEFVVCTGNNKITKGANEYAAPDGFDTNGAEKVKIMVWENVTTFKPLCEAYEKIKKQNR